MRTPATSTSILNQRADGPSGIDVACNAEADFGIQIINQIHKDTSLDSLRFLHQLQEMPAATFFVNEASASARTRDHLGYFTYPHNRTNLDDGQRCSKSMRGVQADIGRNSGDQNQWPTSLD